MSAADNVGIRYAKRNVTDLTRPLERMKSPSVTWLVFLAAEGHLEAGLEDETVTR